MYTYGRTPSLAKVGKNLTVRHGTGVRHIPWCPVVLRSLRVHTDVTKIVVVLEYMALPQIRTAVLAQSDLGQIASGLAHS